MVTFNIKIVKKYSNTVLYFKRECVMLSNEEVKWNEICIFAEK